MVFMTDPEKSANAIVMRYYIDVPRDLKVMDASAISLSRENKIQSWFSINPGGFDSALKHDGAFTRQRRRCR